MVCETEGGFFGGFAIYTIIVLLFGGDNFKVDEHHYLSPIFDPEVELSWWPDNVSPGFILIWAPVGFRATCYYGRKVYYRAFFMDPPGCSIGELRAVDQKYKGENSSKYFPGFRIRQVLSKNSSTRKGYKNLMSYSFSKIIPLYS